MTYEVLLMKMKKKKNTKNPTMSCFLWKWRKKYQKSNSQLLMFSQDSWTAEVYTQNIN